MSEPTRKLIQVLAFDVVFSLAIGVVGLALGGLPLPELILVFSLVVFLIGVAFVQVEAMVTGNGSLPWAVLLIAAVCVGLITIGPFNYAPRRIVQVLYELIETASGAEPAFDMAKLPIESSDDGQGDVPGVTPTPTGVNVDPAPAAAAAPAAAPAVVVAPACATEPQGEFRAVWANEQLGCPVGPEHRIWAAWQKFQEGAMFWREDTDVIYALYRTGHWIACRDEWVEGTPDGDPGDSPPAGCYQPTHGFGKVWLERSGVKDSLGWAVEPEQGMCVTVQDFASGGLLLRYSQAEQGCLAPTGYNPPGLALGLVLRPDGRWASYR